MASIGDFDFKLPDLIAMCDFKASLNPHMQTAGAESAAWVESYNIFSSSKRAYVIQTNSELLAAYTYPHADYEEFRTCVDFIVLLFIIDEVSDDQSGAGARKTLESHLRTLSGEPCDGSVISRMTADFRARLGDRIRPKNLRRLIDAIKHYARTVADEAEDREEGRVLEIEDYKARRRHTGAVGPCFNLFEYCAGIELPDEVFEDPIFDRMFCTAVNLVSWSNDLYSYSMEQAKGQPAANFVTVVMTKTNLSIQEAVDYVGREFQDALAQFMVDKESLRSFGDVIDADINIFINGMEDWVIGNLEWSFASKRYFGAENEKVKATLCVKLFDHDISA